jgi:hypothetical protein
MERKIIDGFKDYSIYDKLKKLQSDLVEISRLIDSIENEQMGENEAASFIRRFIEQKRLKKVESRINRFLRFPLMEPRVGRPVEYPESDHEKRKYKTYRRDGLSIRQIARKEKTSPNTVYRKLKKYQIN